MKKWLVKHGLHPAYITDGLLKFPVKKPAAFLTIDDRAICFNGTFPTSAEMMAFKPWYKRPPVRRPTVEELEEILKQPDVSYAIYVKPDGSITTAGGMDDLCWKRS
jgi:hypothetical protein